MIFLRFREDQHVNWNVILEVLKLILLQAFRNSQTSILRTSQKLILYEEEMNDFFHIPLICLHLIEIPNLFL